MSVTVGWQYAKNRQYKSIFNKKIEIGNRKTATLYEMLLKNISKYIKMQYARILKYHVTLKNIFLSIMGFKSCLQYQSPEMS